MEKNHSRPYLYHIFYGVPLASLGHTVVQYAWDWSRYDKNLNEILWAIAYFLLGIIVGFPVFLVSFLIQAFVFVKLLQLTKNRYVILASGAIVQTIFVTCWAILIGIQPSFGMNHFPMNPVMIATAACIGVLVTYISLKKMTNQKATI